MADFPERPECDFTTVYAPTVAHVPPQQWPVVDGGRIPSQWPWQLRVPVQPDGPQSAEDRYMGREADVD